MKESEVQGTNDEEEDIYKDIGDFRFDRELAKLEESNKAYIRDITKLTKRLNELTETNERLQKINETLETNISILLKTAKAELDRKQLVIDEFRQKIKDVDNKYERNNKYSFKKTLPITKIENNTFQDNIQGDVEDGEIVQDDSEERNFHFDNEKANNLEQSGREYHSSNHWRRQKSHERLRERSDLCMSDRRKSRCIKDDYSRHFGSSRSRHRSTSPGFRTQEIKRSSDRSRDSSKSRHSYRSRSRKSDSSPRRKEDSLRKNYERRRSLTKKEDEKLKKDASLTREKGEKINRVEYVNDKKNETVQFKKDEKFVENEENRTISKTLNIAEYRQKNGSNQNKNDPFVRQSVPVDSFDETEVCKNLLVVPQDITDKSIPEMTQNDNSLGSDRDWYADNKSKENRTKERKQAKEHKTLYSRRMEAKFQNQLQMQLSDDASAQRCENSFQEKQEKVRSNVNVAETVQKNADSDVQLKRVVNEEELSKKQVSLEIPHDKGIEEADCCLEAIQETITDTTEKSQDADPEQSFGETLKKVEQPKEENVCINEFSPLKNNYKLSKISPLKPVSKQHILEYYNLRRSPQHVMNNIESEVLDFSISLSETPSKNFFNTFNPLSDFEECISREEVNTEDKGSERFPQEENMEMTNAISKGEHGGEKFSPTVKLNKTKKRNNRNTKMNTEENEALAETKKITLNEEEKLYKTRYQMRARNRAENEKYNLDEVEDSDKKSYEKNKNSSGEEVALKRGRKSVLSDEGDSYNPAKRIKYDTPKESDICIDSTQTSTVTEDISSFEVFRSISDKKDENVDMLINKMSKEVKNVEEPSWNDNDFMIDKTICNESDNLELVIDKEKQVFSSAGHLGDSTTFKVLRSYLMLSANDDTENEDLDSNSSSVGSGEYSDSGASAFVDLL